MLDRQHAGRRRTLVAAIDDDEPPTRIGREMHEEGVLALPDPCLHCGDQRRGIGGDALVAGELRHEEIGQPLDEAGVEIRIDQPVGGVMPHVADAERIGRRHERAEAVVPQARGAGWRHEMPQKRHERRRAPVGFIGLAGEAVEIVPVRHDVQFGAPFEQADVLQRRHALAHQLQDVGLQAFDARLDRVEPRRLVEPQLILGQVRLGLVEDVEIEPEVGKRGQEILEIGMRDDVVGRRHPRRMGAVARDEMLKLVDRPLRALVAEIDALAVEPAKGAMVLLPPPAPA